MINKVTDIASSQGSVIYPCTKKYAVAAVVWLTKTLTCCLWTDRQPYAMHRCLYTRHYIYTVVYGGIKGPAALYCLQLCCQGVIIHDCMTGCLKFVIISPCPNCRMIDHDNRAMYDHSTTETETVVQ